MGGGGAISAKEIDQSQIAPLSPRFLEWQQQQKEREKDSNKSKTGATQKSKYGLGAIPDPRDFSHLDKNPPKTKTATKGRSKDGDAYLSKYDLRDEKRVPTEVRNQGNFGTCWAHATLGALESSYMTQKLTFLGTEPNLSELHMAWFVYKDPEDGHTFPLNYSSESILDQRGNILKSGAYLGRLAGAVNESSMPYTKAGNDIMMNSYVGNKKPRDYPTALRMVANYNLGTINKDKRNLVKDMIKNYGAVQVSYWSDKDLYFFDGEKTNYFNNNGESINHAVLIVGWDDTFSCNRFSPSKPSSNGAWLIRNSGGSQKHDGGYFYMSYEQYITDGAVFVAGEYSGENYYGYDDLGNNGMLAAPYAANVFQARGNEKIKSIGFFTTDNNAEYKIYVKNFGTSKPSSTSFHDASLIVTSSEPYAGYHTVDVSDYNVKVNAGNYFAVITRMTTLNDSPTAVELKSGDKDVIGYNGVVVNAGESYFANTLTYFRDGIGFASCDGKPHDVNACIKVFTIPSDSVKIDAKNFPDDIFRSYVSSNFDKDKNGYLNTAEMDAVTSINVSKKGITSLKGVENFTNLTSFNCVGNNLTWLDLTANRKLSFRSISTGSQGQVATNVIPKKSGNSYQVSIKDYVKDPSKVSNVVGYDYDGKVIGQSTAYDTNTGVATFVSMPLKVTYKYYIGYAFVGKKYYLDASLGISHEPLKFKTEILLSNGNCTQPYSETIEISGGVAPYSWSSSGNIPSGLKFSFNENKAVLSGTPNTAGTFAFTLKVTDKSKAVISKTFIVTIEMSLGNFSSGILNQPYNSTIEVKGGTAPYSWSVDKRNIPNELVFTFDGNKATLSGTPKTAKAFTFTLQVTDKNKMTVSKTFTVSVLNIVGDFGAGLVNKPYNKSITVEGGVAPYNFTVSDGQFNGCTGLRLSANGPVMTFSGTPTKTGTGYFNVKATDSNGAEISKRVTVTITTAPIINGTFGNGVLKKSYSSFVTVSGGTEPYTWSISGSIPAGLYISYSGAKATIYGTPKAAGTYRFTLTAIDANKFQSTPKSFTVVITEPKLSGSFSSGTVNKSYSGSVSVSGGSGSYSWSRSGSIPTGLKLTYSGAKATLSSKPTKAGTFSFTLKATDKVTKVAVSKKYSVTIKKSTSKSKSAQSQSKDGTSLSNATKKLTVALISETSGRAQNKATNSLETHNITYVPSMNVLNVLSDDVLWHGTERDEDLVKVQANKPVTFVIDKWLQPDGTLAKVSEIQIYIDDKLFEDVIISDEKTFTLPAKFVSSDFKIRVKAKTENSELETDELFILVEE